MKIGVRLKLFSIWTCLILSTLFAFGMILESELRSKLVRETEVELLHYARTTSEMIKTLDTPANLDSLVNRLADAMTARVSIIAKDGKVLTDSELGSAQTKKLENHNQRPEILMALDKGHGISQRYSTTLKAAMLYVAVPFEKKGTLQGTVRIARPLSAVEQAISELRLILILAAVWAGLSALLMSAIASHFTSRAFRRLVDKARVVALSKGSKRIQALSKDEIGGLAGSINQLAIELQQVVASLAVERNRFEAVLDGMGEGVLALDDKKRVTHVNKSAEQMLGLSESPIGRTLLETTRLPALQVLVEQVQPAETNECELSLHTEPFRSLLARATAHKTSKRVVVVIHDLTQLRHLETVRQDFVANVSHELRTPVAVILANTETLIDGAANDPKSAPGFLEAIHRNAGRLASLLTDLLDISRIDSGRYSIKTETIKTKTVVNQVIESLETLCQEKPFSVVQTVGESCVAGDHQALFQVLVNLTENAIKYSEPDGTVKITTHLQGDRIRIEVSDTGRASTPSITNACSNAFTGWTPVVPVKWEGPAWVFPSLKTWSKPWEEKSATNPPRPMGPPFGSR
jgi:two-component system phosphate regulon sensor histidine kinase PhoR